MPQEPYYEVMSYQQAKAAAAQVTTALVWNIGATATDAIGQVLLLKAGLDLETLRPLIIDYIGKNISLAETLNSEAIEGIPTTIENQIHNDYQFMITAIKAGLGQGVGSLHSNIYSALAGVDSLLSGYNGIIQNTGINPFISRWVNKRVQPNIPDAQTAWLMHRIGGITEGQYTDIASQNGWNTDWLTQLNPAWMQPIPIGIMLDLVRRGLITEGDFIWEMLLARFDENKIESIMDLVVQYPEPYRLAEMASKGLTTSDEYLGVTRKFGLEDKWANMWVEGQVRYPDLATSMALLRRGDIDEKTFYFWMQMSQVQPPETEAILKLKDVIPPIQDLIRFAVREAYGDHSSEAQYPTMVDIASKMGLTPQASEWYWYAHWDRIPVNLMFANYHRGNWDTTKLERMLKIVDIHPDDRQDIINVAYQPPNVRELGYGFDTGVYSQPDIVRYRRWGGLSPEDADKAAQALVDYRVDAERNGVRMESMYLFAREKMSEDEFRTSLTALRTNSQAIELWVHRGLLYRERIAKPAMDTEGRIVSSSEALTAFKIGIRDEAWTRAKLLDLDWTPDRIDVAIERAKIDIAEEEAKAVIVKERKFTEAQIRNFYQLKLIGKEQMEVELIGIGYSADDAAFLTELYTTVPEVTPQPKAFTSSVAANLYNLMIFDDEDLYNNYMDEGYDEAQSGLLTMYTILIQTLPSLQDQYEKGLITGEDVVTELKKIEVPEYNARLLVKKITDQYQISRLTLEKDLTKAEIIKGVKNNVLTVPQGISLLEDIGYDEAEATYILAINKVVVAGDPEGYWDMRRVTENFKKARGEKYVDIPEALITFEKQIKSQKLSIEDAKKKGVDEDTIAKLILELGRLETLTRNLMSEKNLK